MRYRRRFLLFFTAYVGLVIILSGVIAYFFLEDAYDALSHPENIEYRTIMADRMMLRAIFSYVIFMVIFLLISILVGIYLHRTISKNYLGVIQEIELLAHNRVQSGENSSRKINEIEQLKEYVALLIKDERRLRELVKINEWKNGARMLMHEIKNPLTPIQLSLQSMQMENLDEEQQQLELETIRDSLRRIESILTMFKELVNIEFGPFETIDWQAFFKQELLSLEKTYGLIAVEEHYSAEKTVVITESNLVSLVLLNLVKNGVEANKNGFYIEVNESEEYLEIHCSTNDVTIEFPDMIFKPGYSEKGEARGFGLFLCKRISDYLDLNLSSEIQPNSVTFSFWIKKAHDR